MKSTPPSTNRPSLATDRSHLIILADRIGRMPSLEHVCIPFFYVFTAGKPSVRCHDNTVLSVERCHGSRIECVNCLDVLRAQRRKFSERIDISKKIPLLTDWRIGGNFLFGEGWKNKSDCQPCHREN